MSLKIPCALSFPERLALKRFAQGVTVLEAGALLGGSTVILAETAHKVISIDRHEGYGPSTLAAFLSNVFTRVSLSNKVIPVVGEASRLIPFVQADRYFVDLDGTYETTFRVLDAIPSRRVVAVHDVGRQSCEGVEKAILAAGYELDEVVDTLAFIRRR